MIEQHTIDVISNTAFAVSIGLNVLYYIAMNKLNKQGEEILESGEQLILQAEASLERENYMLKTINDAMSVSDVAGFIRQRMNNAPSYFEPKTVEEIKPDFVNS